MENSAESKDGTALVILAIFCLALGCVGTIELYRKAEADISSSNSLKEIREDLDRLAHKYAPENEIVSTTTVIHPILPANGCSDLSIWAQCIK